MYGQTRHALERLAREARAGALSPPQIGERIDALLAADWRLVEQAMARARNEARGMGSVFTGNAAAMRAPREEDAENIDPETPL